MSSSSGPDLPQAPQFRSVPEAEGSIQSLFGLGQGLTSGQFLDPSSSLGFLNPLVSLNPQATQQAVGLATRGVERTRDRAQQDIINQLEANNQLTSSVAVNRLSDLNEEFSRDISDINTRFFLADVERSLGNIGSLFGAGLGATEASGQLGLQQQQQLNQFEQQRFSNQVGLAQEQQQQGQGGLFGGLGGAGLGALAGTFLFPGVGTLLGAQLGGGIGAGIGQAFDPSSDPGTTLGFVGGGFQGLQNRSNQDFLQSIFGPQRPAGIV